MTGADGDDANDDPASLLDPTSFLHPASAWTGPSSDPNDEQFGHVVTPATLGPRGIESDVVLVGEPYDGAVIGRKGAVDGPTAIREELAGLKTHRFGMGPVASGDGTDTSLTIADLGDVSLTGGAPPDDDTATVQDRVAAVAGAVHQTDAFPVFLGGDNSLTVGNVRPLLEAAHERDERVGVVNFDAHLDVREPTDGPTSGTPYRQLLESHLDRYVVVGAREFETSTTYADYVEDHGGTILTADELGGSLDTGLTKIASATADLDHLYLSVDLDVLDAAAAPGVSAPTPGGLTTRELFSLVRSVGTDERLAGFELVETAPSLDPAAAPDSPERNRTVGAAARTVAHLLAGVAEGRAR
jgi:formimidoylglutamase